MSVCRSLIYLLVFLSPAAAAHELWIEPARFEVATGDNIIADIRVGQYFKGNSQVFLPDKFVAFTVTDPGGTRPITGRLGDLPAANVPTARDGLHVLAYQSTSASTTYPDFDKFETFLRNQDMLWVIDAHLRRGLGKIDIIEAYSRFAKALVAVGGGAGRDQALGMAFELVAETNPYTDTSGGAIGVRLLLQGEGYASRQISVFQKLEDCEATKTSVLTDSDGRASIPRGSGGRFLVNAVHMMEPAAQTLQQIDAAWESLWASLTFELPETDNSDQGPAECVPADKIGK